MFRLLFAILIGAFAGWAAGKIMKDEGTLLRNIIIGVLGSFVGSGIFGLLGISGGWVFDILVDIAGACLCIYLGKKFFGAGSAISKK